MNANRFSTKMTIQKVSNNVICAIYMAEIPRGSLHTESGQTTVPKPWKSH